MSLLYIGIGRLFKYSKTLAYVRANRDSNIKNFTVVIFVIINMFEFL